MWRWQEPPPPEPQEEQEEPSCPFVGLFGVAELIGAICLDVRTLTFCQLMGFPLN